jgi:hypothetical protein
VKRQTLSQSHGKGRDGRRGQHQHWAAKERDPEFHARWHMDLLQLHRDHLQKYILDRKMYNWPYLVSLTMIHMAFSSGLTFLLVRLFKVVEPSASMAQELYLRSIMWLEEYGELTLEK